MLDVTAPLHTHHRSGDDRPVLIADVRAIMPTPNADLLAAVSRVVIQPGRPETLLAIVASKQIGTLLSETGAERLPLFMNRPNGTEEISA